jgi:inorganic pyrophosphatase
MTGEFLALDAIVEIPRGSCNMYEFDPASASIRLDRVLFSSVHYPGDYGFVVGTKCGDGDALDVLILVEEPTFPGCRVRVRPIGVLVMDDEGGDDEKILAVPEVDPRFAEVYDLSDLPHHWLAEVENFFSTYKVLEGKSASTGEWKGAKEACLAVARRWCRDKITANHAIQTDGHGRRCEAESVNMEFGPLAGNASPWKSAGNGSGV